MQSSDGPTNEAARLATLHQLDVISGPLDAVFESVVDAVASKFSAPMASLTLVDADRQWLRPTVGLGGATSNPRETGFCAQTILQDNIFEVDDTLLNDRFREHALVTGAPFLRWYAGAPLSVKGHRIGALCVMGTEARRLNVSERAFLTSMAEVISRLLEERLVRAERDNALAQVREAQKNEAIGTLAGGIAHDFNNILGIILGNTKLAASDAALVPSVLRSLEEIEKAGLRGRDLVQQILAFSRKQPTNRQVLHPKELLSDMSRLLRPLLPAQVSLVLELQDNTPFIDADRVQLDQVLMNLVTNAAYAMGSKAGEIRIDARGCCSSCLNAERSDHSESLLVKISVTDNGAGMDAETRERLFEPFFTTKPVGEGTGLGLAVVHGIVTRHGGKIVVDSTPGVGTRFDIYLPVANEASVPAPAITTTTTVPMVERKGHVLYIDDDEALVFLVTRLLERSGHEVTSFVSAREALELLRATDQNFDVVISDYNMPGANGLEVLGEVVSLRPGVSVALISGYITDAMREEALMLGVTEIIFKPNSPEELADAMGRLLSVD